MNVLEISFIIYLRKNNSNNIIQNDAAEIFTRFFISLTFFLKFDLHFFYLYLLRSIKSYSLTFCKVS